MSADAAMNVNRARRFLDRIYQTEPEELDCAELIEVIDRYVERQAHGQDAAAVAPGVPQHLRQCADCAELVAVLTQLVELEESGQMPEIDDLWDELRDATGGPSTPSGL